MKKNLFLNVVMWLCIGFSFFNLQAQPAGWLYSKPITITENSGATLTDYQLRLEINTQQLISAGQMQASGGDIRFGADINGATLLNHWVESGVNTANTVIWVKVPLIPANGVATIYLFYGNANTSSASLIDGTFIGPHSSTDSIASGNTGGATNSQRGFRFSPNEDILVNRFGKREPNGSTRYITLFNFATQAIERQHQVSGAAAQYHYSDLSEPIWLNESVQYLLIMYQGNTDGYYFGVSSQIGEHLTYLDMRYCNFCNQNTFPTTVLSGYQYGYPDFHYYTKKSVTPAPTYSSCSEEVCDGIDNNCNGITDEGVQTLFYRDLDADGFGSPSSVISSCSPPMGYVANSTDCNDNSALEKPGQIWYADVDNDGYSSGATLTQCLRPAGYKVASELTATSGDCNDNNAAIKPGATEACDGLDNNCNGQVDEVVSSLAPWSNGNLGAANGTASLECEANSTAYEITAQGVSSPTSDVMHLLYQSLCGAGTITARVNSVTGGGWAGIVIRESLAPGAKKAVLKTQFSNFIRRELRTATNGATTSLNLNRPLHAWLRLERSGAIINGYTSADGVSWNPAFSANISMTNCVYVGLFSESINVNTTTTATFDQVSVSGGSGLQAVTPTGPASGHDAFTTNWNVEVFPNPSSGLLSLGFVGMPQERLEVRALNTFGETVAQWISPALEDGKLPIDLSQQPQGLYFLHISTAGAAPVVKRVVIARE